MNEKKETTFIEHSSLSALIAQTVWFVMLGLLFMYAPTYLGLVGKWKIPFFILGTIPLSFALSVLIKGLGMFDIQALSDWDAEPISTVAHLWYWGVVFMSVPHYLEVGSGLRKVFYTLSAISLFIGVFGTTAELGKRKNLVNKGPVTFWRPGFYLLFPGFLLHILVVLFSPPSPWNLLGKIVALILFGLGIAFLIKAVPYTSYHYNRRIVRQIRRTGVDTPPQKPHFAVDGGSLVDVNTMVFRFLTVLLIVTAIMMIV